MRLRITSITTPEVGQLVGNLTTMLEDRLRPSIETQDYGTGIAQFVVFFVSVDSDLLENERYCVANNRCSRYKDLVTGEIVKFIGLAVPIDPALILRTPEEALPGILGSLLLDEVAIPAYALPRTFDRPRLAADLRAAFARVSPSIP